VNGQCRSFDASYSGMARCRTPELRYTVGTQHRVCETEIATLGQRGMQTRGGYGRQSRHITSRDGAARL
jgi:hypothetical protein